MAQGPHVKLSRFLRGWLRALGLRKYGIGVLTATPQGLFVVDPRDFGVGRALLDRGQYDVKEIDYLLAKTTPESTVVFVGAHIGSILVPIAKKVAKVIAFEPNPPTFQMLEANVRLNGLSNVVLYPYALSDENGFVTISHNTVNTGGSSVAKAQAAGQGNVECKRMDDLIDDAVIDLMVVDAEGHEIQVYSGAQACLARTKTLYTEFSPRLLRKYGASAVEFVAAMPENFTRMKFIEDSTAADASAQRADWLKRLNGLPRQERVLVNLTFD